MTRDPACSRCTLHAATKWVCLYGEGRALPGGVMLLGEAPGAVEEVQGRPFVGDAGREIDSALRDVGKARTDVYITNAVKCRPPGNRTPVQAELNACSIHLAAEIDLVQPKVILCLGGAALKALTGKESVGSHRSQIVEPKRGIRTGNAKVLVTYHPASVLHNRSRPEQIRIREAIRTDLTLAFRLAGEPISEPSDHKRALLTPGYTAETLKRALSALDSCAYVAADLEWTALKDRDMTWPWTPGAECYSLSLSGRLGTNVYSVAFSWPLPLGGLDVLNDFLSNKPSIWHNALADLNWTESLGVRVRLGGDTLILSYLMNEEEGHRLEQLAVTYAGVDPGWKIGPWDKPPIDRDGWLELLGYNANDTYATIKLVEALYARLAGLPPDEQDGIKRIYYHLLLPVLPTMVDIALAGLPMDPAGLKEELAKSLERTEAVKAEIAGLTGMTLRQAAAMAGSPDKAMKYLQQAYGLEIDSSNKDDLAGYEGYPVIGLIQKYRWERNKVQGTYLGPWDELLGEQGDSRLRSVYRLTYARTGRTSAEIEKGGSLQLMPREQAGRELEVRHLVKARPGWKIISADYSQVEIRVMAWFANERNMLALYAADEDLHKATAAFIKNQPISLSEFWPNRGRYMAGITKDDRQLAKGVNFGLLYKQEVQGLIDYCRRSYGVSMTWEQGELAHRSWFMLYPDVRTYHEYCERVIFPRGYTETPFGRRRRNLEDARKAINTPIQATASDLALFAMYHIHRAFKAFNGAARLVGFVHDSILAEVRDDYVEQAAVVIRHEMEQPDLRSLGVDSLRIPLKADVVIGQSWGEAK